MNKNVDVEILIDESCPQPKVTIRTEAWTPQVENLVTAIERAFEPETPPITAYLEGGVELVSQRDAIRVRTEGRTVVLDTAERTYRLKQTLSQVEGQLDPERFCRISQSEIVNLYKIKLLDVSMSGMVALEFDNGIRTYIARRHVKGVKERIKKIGGEGV